MNKVFNILATIALAVGISELPAQAQIQTASTTTLGAAITSASQTTITLASTSTMLSAGPVNQVNTILWVDNEYMTVSSVVDSTHVIVNKRGVTPGVGGRPLLHNSGTTVYFFITTNGIPAPSFVSFGQLIYEIANTTCVIGNEKALPLIYTFTGKKYDCLGGAWVETDQPGPPVLGATVASPAGVMTPTGTIFLVSGTNAITGITVPNGFAPGMSITLIPTGVFTTTTATNIRLASTAVVGKALIMTYDGTKFSPSY
jgi:hypothetical protein